MATYLENLTTRRDKIAAALAELEVFEGYDKPNHNGEAAVDYAGKIEKLRAELSATNNDIAVYYQQTPYMRESRGA
jgi:hypothetical protein